MTSPNGGTRDLCGVKGLTTVKFVEAVRGRLDSQPKTTAEGEGELEAKAPYEIDTEKVKELFDSLDSDGSGTISFQEFSRGIQKLGIAPRKLK
jgi:hypothetical protein